jgi:hypothetical protein
LKAYVQLLFDLAQEHGTGLFCMITDRDNPIETLIHKGSDILWLAAEISMPISAMTWTALG